MKLHSIKKRLLIGSWLALLLIMLPTLFVMEYQLRKNLMAEARSVATERLHVTAWLLRQNAPFPSDKALHDWVSAYALRLGSHIRIIDGNRVVADSNLVFNQLPPGLEQELQAEITGARADTHVFFSLPDTLFNWKFLHAATPVHDMPGYSDCALWLNIPISSIYSSISLFRGWALTAVSILALAATALVCLSFSHILKKTQRMAESVQAIGQGDFERRVTDVASVELTPLAEAINVMAYDAERHMHQLREQNEQMTVLFSGMREGVMLLDARGRVMAVNPAFVRLFHYTEDAAGKTPLEVTGRDDVQQAVNALAAHPAPDGTRLMLELQAGRTVEASLVPFGAVTNLRMLLVFHDMSERVIVDHMRRDFVANISHELKTPLTSIKGYVETLMGAPISFEQAQVFLATILRNADHMNKLVNSLLTLAHAEYKNDSAFSGVVDAADNARLALHDMLPLAAQKSIRLSHSLAEEELWVEADDAGLGEVLRSLLDNAIKYSPEGTEVHISCTPARAPGERTVLTVADQGPGIAAPYQARIFERFFRVPTDAKEKKDGSAGLGLAICRRIVASFGGSIELESPLRGESLAPAAAQADNTGTTQCTGTTAHLPPHDAQNRKTAGPGTAFHVLLHPAEPPARSNPILLSGAVRATFRA